jgi:predicted dinucleotide-binding enzyme
MVKLTKKAKAIARARRNRLPEFARKKPAPVVVNKVALQPGHVVSVTVPVDHTPVVVADHGERRVEIVPVPLPVVRAKRGWWQEMFGPYED